MYALEWKEADRDLFDLGTPERPLPKDGQIIFIRGGEASEEGPIGEEFDLDDHDVRLARYHELKQSSRCPEDLYGKPWFEPFKWESIMAVENYWPNEWAPVPESINEAAERLWQLVLGFRPRQVYGSLEGSPEYDAWWIAYDKWFGIAHEFLAIDAIPRADSVQDDDIERLLKRINQTIETLQQGEQHDTEG